MGHEIPDGPSRTHRQDEYDLIGIVENMPLFCREAATPPPQPFSQQEGNLVKGQNLTCRIGNQPAEEVPFRSLRNIFSP
jgi:hypothetical protein